MGHASSVRRGWRSVVTVLRAVRRAASPPEPRFQGSLSGRIPLPGAIRIEDVRGAPEGWRGRRRPDPRYRTGPGLRSPETSEAQLRWLSAMGRETDDLAVPEPVPLPNGSPTPLRFPAGTGAGLSERRSRCGRRAGRSTRRGRWPSSRRRRDASARTSRVWGTGAGSSGSYTATSPLRTSCLVGPARPRGGRRG